MEGRPSATLPARAADARTAHKELSFVRCCADGGRRAVGNCLSVCPIRERLAVVGLAAANTSPPHLAVLTGLSDPRNLQEHMQEINLNIYFNGVRTDSQKITFKQFFSIFTLAKV